MLRGNFWQGPLDRDLLNLHPCPIYTLMHRYLSLISTSNSQCCIVRYPAPDLYIRRSIYVSSTRFIYPTRIYISDSDLYIGPGFIYIIYIYIYIYIRPGFIYPALDLHIQRWIYISDSRFIYTSLDLYIRLQTYISNTKIIYLLLYLYVYPAPDLYIRVRIYISDTRFIYLTPNLYIYISSGVFTYPLPSYLGPGL